MAIILQLHKIRDLHRRCHSNHRYYVCEIAGNCMFIAFFPLYLFATIKNIIKYRVLIDVLRIMSEEKPRWTIKKRQREIAAKARAGKQLKIEATRTTQADDSDISDVSLVLSRVDSDTEEQGDAIGGPHFPKMMLLNITRNGYPCQPKETTKMIAILMMDVFRMWFRLTDVSAAKKSSLMVGFNEETIRIWHNEFCQCHGDFTESGAGKHLCPYVLDDENCRKKALS